MKLSRLAVGAGRVGDKFAENSCARPQRLKASIKMTVTARLKAGPDTNRWFFEDDSLRSSWQLGLRDRGSHIFVQKGPTFIYLNSRKAVIVISAQRFPDDN
jgi:hypothetical protein